MGSCLMVDIGECRVAPVPVCPLTQILAFFVRRSSRSVLSPSNGVVMLICPREPVNTSSSNPPALYQSTACRPSPLLAPLQHHEYHAHHPTKSPKTHSPSTHPSHHPSISPHTQPAQTTTTTTGVPPRLPHTIPLRLSNPNSAPTSPPSPSSPDLPPRNPFPFRRPSREASHVGSAHAPARQPATLARFSCSCDGTGTAALRRTGRAFPISTHPVCMYTVPETTYLQHVPAQLPCRLHGPPLPPKPPAPTYSRQRGWGTGVGGDAAATGSRLLTSPPPRRRSGSADLIFQSCHQPSISCVVLGSGKGV